MYQIKPSKILETTLKDIECIFDEARAPAWLCFGALWGLIVNHGVIPDADFDMCTYYGQDWKKIAKAAESQGYRVKKVLLDDTNLDNALYMGFYNDEDIYVCVSFWYPWEGLRFWCHDQNQDVKDGAGVPSGYWFKGCPRWMVEGERFLKVEWPGIDQRTTVRVPQYAGSILDLCYRGWPYMQQRYVVQNYQVQIDKMVSINDPIYNRKNPDVHAVSPHRVHVKSMAEFLDKAKINLQLQESQKTFDAKKVL